MEHLGQLCWNKRCSAITRSSGRRQQVPRKAEVDVRAVVAVPVPHADVVVINVVLYRDRA